MNIIKGAYENRLEANNIPDATGAVLKFPTKAIIDSFRKLSYDIIDPAWNAVTALPTGVAGLVSKKYRNGNRFAGLIKAPVNMVSNAATVAKNIPLGAVSGINNLYQVGIKDTINNLSHGTVGRIPGIGKYIDKTLNFGLSTVGLVPHIANEIAKVLDKPFEVVNNATNPAGRAAVHSRARTI